jgi:O-antigen ligase
VAAKAEIAGNGREDRLERWLWIALLLVVPISSSPFLPLGEGTTVRPLAFVPALLLLGSAAVRLLLLGQRPNFSRDRGSFALLFCFGAYVLVSGLAIVATLPDASFKGQTPLDSLMRAFATLVIGIVFYTLARLNIRTRADAALAEKWLFIGLGASIALALVQALAIFAGGDALRTVDSLTGYFTVREAGIANRGQGMSSEPSVLANQITLLIVPFLAARMISRQDFVATPRRRMTFRIAIGFLFVLVGLLSSGSRFGLVSAVLVLIVSSLRALWRGRIFAAIGLAAVIGIGAAGVALLVDSRVGAGNGYVVGAIPAVAALSTPDFTDPDQAALISNALNVSGRVAASQSAATMWLDHPLFGVSFGNAYRNFGRYFPDWALETALFDQLGEGASWLDPNAPEKGNAKNLLLRLLAETGLVGAGLFLLFFVRNVFHADQGDRYFGAFRIAAAAALMISWMNLDTFADPAMWLLLAFCHAAGRIQESHASVPARLPSFSVAPEPSVAAPVG